ncbi:MAG TPA: glycosyltransferase family 4 protein [Anaerolineales bacterium]|nr:glycosyltransferase family 4 protein [Anaerolineales bacterium]
MAEARFSGKLAIQQRVLTPYRAAFFDALAGACQGGLSVCAGLPRPGESIATTDRLLVAQYRFVNNRHLLGGPLYFCSQAGLPAWLEDWDPDVLIVEANPRYLATPAAVRWMKSRGRPVLGWGLGAPPLSGPLAGLRRARRLSFLKQFDALLTYSQRGASEYASLRFPNGRIFVAPNAAAARPSGALPARPAGFAGRPSLLFVGRLQARKRLDLLLQACAALPETLRPRLVVVGEGPERAALEGLAKTIYPAAEFPGAKHGAELAPYFLAADLFVLPGTGGLAVQEAMSFGLPVIMGQGDGTNDDLVRPPSGTMPGNGWQLPPDDPSALRETLQTALSDVTRLRRMGAESYRIVAEEINLEKMVGVFIEAIGQVSKAGRIPFST